VFTAKTPKLGLEIRRLGACQGHQGFVTERDGAVGWLASETDVALAHPLFLNVLNFPSAGSQRVGFGPCLPGIPPMNRRDATAERAAARCLLCRSEPAQHFGIGHPGRPGPNGINFSSSSKQVSSCQQDA
jgi:hypothetical protein